MPVVPQEARLASPPRAAEHRARAGDADPARALVIAVLAAREGIESWRQEEEP
jgi:hypothetical protein